MELPSTLTVGAIQREITFHLRQQAEIRREITAESLARVLDNWVVRGVRYDNDRRPSMAHLGLIEYGGAERLMRVGVSMDDRRIVTTFLDSTATNKLNSGDMGYFESNYENPEVRG